MAAGRNDVISAYAHVALLQRDVIDGQIARHLLANQYQLHLRTQLAAKSRPKAPGGVLKSGFGALDEEALCALEAEQDAKITADVGLQSLCPTIVCRMADSHASYLLS